MRWTSYLILRSDGLQAYYKQYAIQAQAFDVKNPYVIDLVFSIHAVGRAAHRHVCIYFMNIGMLADLRENYYAIGPSPGKSQYGVPYKYRICWRAILITEYQRKHKSSGKMSSGHKQPLSGLNVTHEKERCRQTTISLFVNSIRDEWK